MEKRRMMTLGVAILSVMVGVVAVAVLLWAVGRARASPPMEPLAQGGAPLLLNYQGRLADPTTGLPKPDGTYTITFKIHDAETGGTLIWFETQVVSVTRGLFNVLLGSSTALSASDFDGTSRWLELEVEGETLSPRVRMVSVPYAIQAEEAKNAWRLTGNAGTTGSNFLGTTDNEALELRVNNARALRLLPNATSPNLIGGYSGNSVTAGVVGATIGGGGKWSNPNRVTDDYGTVGGGRSNQAGNDSGTTLDGSWATVGGGIRNTASGYVATVGGGMDNTASGEYATIGGGLTNVVTATHATVGGGYGNTVSGSNATVSGGSWNTANDDWATVGGGLSNTASGDSTTVGGGRSNTASDMLATVGGGSGNTASGMHATVGGGTGNTVSDNYATVGGGGFNTASDYGVTVGGGRENTASGYYATVPGGLHNTAQGPYSFAAGRRAKANHQGAFVWTDSTDADFASTANNQFLVRASGNVGINTNAPGSTLTVSGTIESTSGGIKFPDGTVQTTAATGGGTGDITAVYAGTGLTGGGDTGDVTLSLDTAYTDDRYWSLTGNSGITPATNFLGTTDNQALELRVNNARVLRLEPNDPYSPNLIGGYSGNRVTDGVVGATIGGGGASGNINRVTDDYGTVGGGYINQAGDGAGTITDAQYATVGGGYLNTASGEFATVAGGYWCNASGFVATVGGGLYNNASGYAATVPGGWGNTASGKRATIGGGSDNNASGERATIGGGASNNASGEYATVGGGLGNAASGPYATIPGGSDNTAQGSYSFAAGRRAKAYNQGCFVWGDSTDGNVTCSNDNSWVARARGGVYFYTSSAGGVYVASGGNSWNAISDRATKENLTPIDGRAILDKLATLSVQDYNLKSQAPSIRHVGPVAQDFYAAFGYGESDRAINMEDADGVALSAIQGLYQLSQEQANRIEALEAENATLQQQMDDLETRMAALEQTLNMGHAAASSTGLPTFWLLFAGLPLLGLVLGWRQYRGGG